MAVSDIIMARVALPPQMPPCDNIIAISNKLRITQRNNHIKALLKCTLYVQQHSITLENYTTILNKVKRKVDRLGGMLLPIIQQRDHDGDRPCLHL
jgi:hypothetical protein